jgi:hypothetical protein
MTKYIDFSIDYDGNCECVDDFLINDEEVSINDDSDVQPLIEELQKVEGFYLSEHRTQVRIWWNEDGTMDVRYRYFNEPDWGEFDDFELLGLPPIEFEPETV